MKKPFRTQTISDFRRSGTKCVAKLRRHGEPLLLTVRGKATVIVQDAVAFEQMIEDIISISRGLAEADRNEGVSVGRAFASAERILKVYNQ